jgi:ribosomal protein L11 methyltransferase
VLALVVSTTAQEVEVASDVLWSLGVVAIEERIAEDGIELWTSLGDDVDIVTDAAEQRLDRWSWRLVEIDEAVADTWRAHAAAVHIDPDLVICPAWVSYESEPGETVLRIEPGSTFGLGDHPTTMLSMRALRAVLFEGATVLDVGCGSGVLAVGACVLGASRATAIDISPAAVPITTTNASANGVSDRVDVSTTPLSDVDGAFDVVVANILAPTLIDLADELRRVVKPGGALIISGVLADRHDHVEAALRPLLQTHRATLEGWAAITLRSSSHAFSSGDTSSTSSAGR